MSFFDLLQLSVRNLREAKLRATLTTMGVIVGVAMIVTMMSFGLGLQRNTIQRFKELDLFNEITVFGKSLSSLATAGQKNSNNNNSGGDNRANREREGRGEPDKPPEKILDDAAVTEIGQIPGVASVEPTVFFNAYLRSNNHVQMQNVGGALVPNPATRFKEFAAGQMISAPDSGEAVVDEEFARNFGYAKPADAIGNTVDFLAPPEKGKADEEESPNFFGIPLDEGDAKDEAAPADALVARTYRIVGVLKSEDENGQRRFRGLMPTAPIYISLKDARSWREKYRDNLSEVALELARSSGALKENQQLGYGSAVVRVSDPVKLTEVRKRITELGFGSFSIMDQLEQLRLVFLIINSALGLLGGISLLVASFGIANTMIMSILERTREIGIMKAIGAEDREIKLIFFIEASVIGFAGGVLGCLVAWGIDAVANRLAYRFILKPQGANFVDFFALPPYLWLGAIVFAVLISIIAALYPAARAARIDPVRALRHD
ncbi:MAG TPA: ABC transporter permease [Pyrinomonadaceae bacterium]|jgi:putative ABC transport system permease protein